MRQTIQFKDHRVILWVSSKFLNMNIKIMWRSKILCSVKEMIRLIKSDLFICDSQGQDERWW